MPRPASSGLRTPGPALGVGRKRRGPLFAVVRAAAVAAVIGLVGWLSLRTIVQDLATGAHLAATHKSEAGAVPRLPPTAIAQATGTGAVPAAPGAMPAQARPTGQALQPPLRDPVATALLAAARDHLGRKVTPTVYSVDDLRANAGNHLDLVERGLAAHLPLKTALVRHRSRNPQLYGLAGKPPLTLDERRRAWNGDNLELFLQAFARLRSDGDAQPGDIAVLRRQRGNRKLVAVVSDVTDEAGRPQFVVLDPGERAAREVAGRQGYQVVRVFALGASEVARVRQLLDLTDGAAGTPL